MNTKITYRIKRKDNKIIIKFTLNCCGNQKSFTNIQEFNKLLYEFVRPTNKKILKQINKELQTTHNKISKLECIISPVDNQFVYYISLDCSNKIEEIIKNHIPIIEKLIDELVKER